MKELSIEEKAKAYDEAKARMSRAFNSNRCTIGFMNEIFPELRENWDEKIRTKLIEFFSGYNTDEEWWGSITEKDILAWLEKQGEHDSIEEPNFFDDFRNSDVEVDSNEDGLIADTIRCKIEKQGEQKFAAWSDDELDSITAAINNLEYLKNNYAYHQMGLEPAITFLKSLKERYTWKPSDRQMNVLEYYMHTLACNEHKEILFGLYQDLKKLKE